MGEDGANYDTYGPVPTIRTPLTDLLKIRYPVMSAGMGSVSSHELVAAVSNVGGIGTFGGLAKRPPAVKQEIAFLKEIIEPGKPWGFDLLIPQIGGNARKTNKDYTRGDLDEITDILIAEKCALFVCAVGVPPVWCVERLHAAGIPVMNMIGAPHHVEKALEVGCDIICAQGTEAGGHTGDVATFPLIPQCVDLCRGRKNFFGSDVVVVAAGGIFDGRGLAAALALGASGVWVGTRFIATPEAATSEVHKRKVVNAKSIDMTRTLIYTGRPARVLNSDYVRDWEAQPQKMKELMDQGIVPFNADLNEGKTKHYQLNNDIMGQAAGAVTEQQPAAEIVESMMRVAVAALKDNLSRITAPLAARL